MGAEERGDPQRPPLGRTVPVHDLDRPAHGAYRRAAREYARKLSQEELGYLFTKPYHVLDGWMPEETYVYLRDTAEILRLLDLPGGASILDVACGSGWLTEALWRSGYRVVGVDVSDELLRIARDRIRAAAAAGPWARGGRALLVAMDVEANALEAKFHAIVLYDCLHHFVDLDRVFDNLERLLRPEGKLLIKEGSRPLPGSPGELRLTAETARFGTLESPFDHDVLFQYLKTRELGEVRRLTVPPALDIDAVRGRWRDGGVFQEPHVNFFLCDRSGAGLGRETWTADLHVEQWRQKGRGADSVIEVVLQVRNTGTAQWSSTRGLGTGEVALGFRLRDSAGSVIDEFEGRTPLGRQARPGESVRVATTYPVGRVCKRGRCEIEVDLVLQGRFWFGERGAPTIRRVLTVEP